MSKTVVFVHTIPSLVETFARLVGECLPPDTITYHVADEMLLKIVMRDGHLSPFIFRRVARHAEDAEQAGADLVQVTCSSISPCVDYASKLVSIPVLKIDPPMVHRALEYGDNIGVAATVPTTLDPTTDLIRQISIENGSKVNIEAVMCEGAFEALSAGDRQQHDKIIRKTLVGLMEANDAVVLAQASMARVADTLPDGGRSVPVLSSPRLAVEHLASTYFAT